MRLASRVALIAVATIGLGVSASFANVQPGTATTGGNNATGGTVSGGAGQCQLANAAAMNQRIMSKNAVTIGDNVFAPPEKMPSKMACLSTVINGISLPTSITLPSISSIIDGLLQQACQALQNEWNDAKGQLLSAVSLPYGLDVSLGQGGNTIGIPGVEDVTGVDIGEVTGEIGGAVNEGAGSVQGQSNQIGAQEDAAADAAQGAIDGATDNIDIFGGSNNDSNIYN